jgi:Asp-tRNA(Asn)/Glu-tRNA(Gln) amidotransferase A subunit family amidase
MSLKRFNNMKNTDSLFHQHSINDIHTKLKLGKLEPEEISANCLKFYQKFEALIDSFVCFSIDDITKNYKAFRFTETTQNQNYLENIPFGAKDIFNTRGFPTQMGSELWAGFQPGNNARVVDSALIQGAMLVGKTATAEFAVHALGKTKNPHDPSRTPGTSSSGSAAAVSAGIIPFALATQTAGSIIRPSSYCGVWGFKPSFGLIPRTGVLKTTDTLDTIGYITSHALNLRPLLDVLRVRGPNYPYVYKYIDCNIRSQDSSEKEFKIGYVKTHTWDESQSYVKEAFNQFLDALGENGFPVEKVVLPTSTALAHSVHESIYVKSLAYYFEQEAKSQENISQIMDKMIQQGKSISIKEFKTALHHQVEIAKTISEAFSQYDVIISLSTAHSAPLRDVEELDDPSLIWTLSHLPSLNVPAYRCKSGLPFGIQVVAKKYNDYRIIDFVEHLIKMEILSPHSLEILND